MRFTKDQVFPVGPLIDGLKSVGDGHIFEPPKVQVWKGGFRVGSVHWLDTEEKLMHREDPDHMWLDDAHTARTPEADRQYLTEPYDSLTVTFHLVPTES